MSRFTPWEWDDEECDEVAELRAERRRERRYAAALLRHPDPRDPDWPGHEEDYDEEAEHDREFDENRIEDDDD